MAKKKQEKQYCRSCKYSSDYGNHMITCKFQEYPLPANWICNIENIQKSFNNICVYKNNALRL